MSEYTTDVYIQRSHRDATCNANPNRITRINVDIVHFLQTMDMFKLQFLSGEKGSKRLSRTVVSRLAAILAICHTTINPIVPSS